MSDPEELKEPELIDEDDKSHVKVSGDTKALKDIARWSVESIKGNFNRQELDRLALQHLNIDVSGFRKATAIEMMKKRLGQLDKERDQGKGPKFGIRCVRCGRIAVEFERGFDPRTPVDPAGTQMPFWRWPSKFVGPPTMKKEELENRSKEKPRCPRCEKELPLRTGGYAVLGRALVEID